MGCTWTQVPKHLTVFSSVPILQSEGRISQWEPLMNLWHGPPTTHRSFAASVNSVWAKKPGCALASALCVGGLAVGQQGRPQLESYPYIRTNTCIVMCGWCKDSGGYYCIWKACCLTCGYIIAANWDDHYRTTVFHSVLVNSWITPGEIVTDNAWGVVYRVMTTFF